MNTPNLAPRGNFKGPLFQRLPALRKKLQLDLQTAAKITNFSTKKALCLPDRLFTKKPSQHTRERLKQTPRAREGLNSTITDHSTLFCETH